MLARQDSRVQRQLGVVTDRAMLLLPGGFNRRVAINVVIDGLGSAAQLISRQIDHPFGFLESSNHLLTGKSFALSHVCNYEDT
jgi:hypothetical protein